MANRGNREDAHIVLTEFDGTTTRLLLREGSRIQRGPTTGQGQVTTIGESERRGDTRTPQVIWSDQGGGMGEFAYQEINGVTTFTDSELDTRYAGQLVLPPAATLLSTMSYTPSSIATPVHVEYLGQADAQILTWQWNVSSSGAYVNRYDPSPSGFTAITTFQNVTGYAKFGSYYVFTSGSANSIKYSTDGVTFTSVAIGAGYYGCCVHDLKFYAWDLANSRLTWTTDVTTAAGWSTSAAFYPGDLVIQLVEWQRGGRTAVFVIARNGIFWYDEDADAFHAFYDFVPLSQGVFFPWATTSLRDGNMYVTLYNLGSANNGDMVVWFSGTANETGPNQHGGMLAASQVSLTHAVSGKRWVYFFGAPRIGTSNVGRVLAMTDNQAFHTMNIGTSASLYVLGGGYAIGKLWTVLADGKVYEQAVPDDSALPLYATGRSYKANVTYYHEFAFTDLGSENLPLTALWVEIASRKMNSTYHEAGMTLSGSGVVEYMRDTDTAWTQLGTFGGGNAWPVRFEFRGGYGLMANEIKLRVGILSSDSSRSPVITSVALAALREEAVRDAYACVVDLTRDSHTLYSGKTRTELLTVLERIRQPGVLVKLQFAGGNFGTVPSTGRTITSCKVEWSGEEDAEEGPGMYSLRLTDNTKPDFTAQIAAQPAS